jgi:ABC-2 type transport system ATP-binding protein
VRLLDCDVARQPDAARRLIGVTFQSPSLDTRLTVFENLKHQSRLYGLPRSMWQPRMARLLDELGLSDRRDDRVDSLSGGQRRRVEIAKGLLHDPQILLLDEPSAGLDPGARIDLWHCLDTLRQRKSVTILLTTHLMEEADKCDRVAILDHGRLVVSGRPETLRSELGGDCVSIHTQQPEELSDAIFAETGQRARQLGGALRWETPSAQDFIASLMSRFSERIDSITWGKPTLEDVFIHHTGHRFWDHES